MREGYKKTEIGVIPVEWEVVKLGDFCDILDNKRVPLSSEQRATIKGSVPYYGANGVVDYINDFLFDEELVLLAEDGGNFSEYETRPIAYMINGKSWVNNHTHILRAKNNQNHYLFYNLVHKNIMAFINGGTRAKLNRGELVKIKIPLPPLKEQKEIANILSTSDKKIEAIDLQIQKAETLKKGLLQKLLSEGITKETPNGRFGHSEFKDSELGRIPVGWEINELGKATTYVDYRGKTPTKTKSGVFLVTAKNIKGNKINYSLSNEYIAKDDYEKVMSRGKPKIGDILLTTEAPLGEIASIDKEYVALAQRIIKYRGIENYLDNSFLKHYFISSKFQNLLLLNSTGSTVKGIKGSRLKKLKIVIPPLKEQKQIAQILSISDEKIELLRAKKEKYETLKKGLLQKLLSGEVRVGCCP